MADTPVPASTPTVYDSLTNGNVTFALHSKCRHPCKQTEFDELFQYTKPQKPALYKRIVRSRCPSPVRTIYSFFPILTWLPNYQWKRDLFSDVISGFTVAIMHVPQGMAYALLGGVPPIVGLYMAFFPVLLYIIMGTSKHISMGTFAVVCMMASKSILLYSMNDSVRSLNSSVEDVNSTHTNDTTLVLNNSSGYSAVQVATALCFTVGVWQVLLGILRLGVLSVLLSDTLVSGFTTGAAVHVLTSQVKNVFGVKIPRHSGPLKVIYTYIDLIKNIHTTNFMALGMSAAFIVILSTYNELVKPRISKKLPIPLPVELLVITAGTVISMFCELDKTYNVDTIGDIPTGLPSPSPPPFALIPNLVADGLVIAIVAFSVNMSMASIFATKLKYSIDANQELLASGFSNIFASFFSCIPFAASLSRSLIQQTVGGKTQLASLVSCLLLLLVLLVIGPFFEPLPNCILASIIVVALKGMFMQIKDVPATWHKSPFDGFVWLVTFLAVVILDIDYGLGLGIALSLCCVLIMGQRPKISYLGHVPSTDIYLNINRYQTATEIPGIRIIQVAGGLHFANKEHVQKKVCEIISGTNVGPQTNSDTKKLPDKCPLSNQIELPSASEVTTDLLAHKSEDIQVFCLIMDMMSVCFVDPSAIKTLLSVYKDLESRGIMFCLADCSASVYERLVHCGFFETFPDSHLFPTVHDAVLFAKQSNLEANKIQNTQEEKE